MLNYIKKFLFVDAVRTLKGEWSSMSLMDKGQGCVQILGFLGIITWAASPELEALLEIKNRLAPPVEKYDTVYVSKAARKGDEIAIDLKKVRTEDPLQYQVWMCTGRERREMIFFGEGHLGREEAENTLRVSIPDTPSQLLLKVTAKGLEYGRVEEWDLYRSVKESDTKVVQGDVNCGEV